MGTWSKNNTGKPVTTDVVRSSVGAIAKRIDNLEKGLDGTDSLNNISITGGAIDGTVIGGTTPSLGNFTQANIDNITIDGNTITSSNGVVNAFGAKPADETGATLVVNISGYTTTQYIASPGWYTCEIKGAGGCATNAHNAYEGGYIKTSFYVTTTMMLRCTSSSRSPKGVLSGGGSSVISSIEHLFIAGGGAGDIINDPESYGGHNGHAFSGAGYIGGAGGDIPFANLGFTSGTSTSPKGKNNVDTRIGGGAAGGTTSSYAGQNGSIKLWKH